MVRRLLSTDARIIGMKNYEMSYRTIARQRGNARNVITGLIQNDVRDRPKSGMNEYLTTPQDKNKIGYWVPNKWYLH